MYQSPDFIKVNLDIKDNFAAYGQPCIELVWTTWEIGKCDVPGYVFETYTQMLPNATHECYNKVI